MSYRRRPLVTIAAALTLLGVIAGNGIAAASTGHVTSVRSSAHLDLVHAGVLSVGADTTYPPMESSDVKHPGQFVGADVDLANALGRAMGLKGARIVVTNFNSIIPSLQRRNFDVIMSSMNDNADRRKQIAFVDYMHLVAAQAILVNKNSSIHAATYAGLCGHSISVESGTTELDGLNAANKSCSKKIDIHSYTADTAAFQAFASGHTEAYTADLPVGLFYVKAHSGAIRFANKAFGTGGYYGIGLLKNAKGLHAALVKALNTIRHNGTYVRILKRWGLGSTAFGVH